MMQATLDAVCRGSTGCDPVAVLPRRDGVVCPSCGKPAIRAAMDGLFYVHAEQDYGYGIKMITDLCFPKVKP